MISPIVEAAPDGTTNILGKSAKDLQKDVEVGKESIWGTLHYVQGYTGFSGNTDQQNGNYLALNLKPVEGTSIKFRIIGGNSLQKDVPKGDNSLVLKIANNDQKIEFVTTKGDETETKVYSLKDLILEPAPAKK